MPLTEGDLQCILGFDEVEAKKAFLNAKVVNTLERIIAETKKYSSFASSSNVAKNLRKFVMLMPKKDGLPLPGRFELIIQYIIQEKISSDLQVTTVMKYISSECLIKDSNKIFNEKFLDELAGVGIVISSADITKCVNELIESQMVELISKRYTFNFLNIINAAVAKLVWANRKDVMDEVEAQKLDRLGPKTTADVEAEMADKASKKSKGADKKKGDSGDSLNAKNNKNSTVLSNVKVEENIKLRENVEDGDNWDFGPAVAEFHKVGENHLSPEYVVTPNTMKHMEEHYKAVNGKVRTRFPPEPNGILHIGHAKAMNFNFSYAKANGGECYLRYDDTNPETEERRYFTGILDMVKWLGHEPSKITCSSDYFMRLYELGEKLITTGYGYVDHQTAEEMHEERGGDNNGPRRNSPWRDRPIEDSLRVFREMRQGLWDEGKACLRMKMDMTNPNPQFWDLVAYRVKYAAHVRSGNAWCVYPTYDFTHCLVDSFENITHSLCTVEFYASRASYYWLCNALDIYCPTQWEYSRLDIENTVLSKRKILKLLADGICKDWDDPRLHTLPGLKRRGYPPKGINNLCRAVGISRAMSQVPQSKLEFYIRDYLNVHAKRTMVVLDPLKITITNFQGPKNIFKAPDTPQDPKNADKMHDVVMTNVIYIDRIDFVEKGEKGFRRLTLDQSVGLVHASTVLSVTDVIRDTLGKVLELKATIAKTTDEGVKKPKAFVHWVSDDPVQAEVRLYDPLLDSANGNKVNENSCSVISNALISKTLCGSPVESFWQFERIGYFTVDPDSTNEKMVFNRTVSLKEDREK